MQKLFIGLAFIFMGFSLSAQRLTPQEYIENFKDLAIKEMKRNGVPASIILAQGILESDCGNSDLVQRSNNHFGIKCKSTWTGPSVFHDDDELDECFRAYLHAEGSYRDHSDFLKSSPRYAFLFDLNPEDYSAWAHGLKKAGYATNPKYASLLIQTVDRYNLNQYTIEGMLEGVRHEEYLAARDNSMLPENFIEDEEPEGVENLVETRHNGLKAVRVLAGTSLLMVATKFNVRLGRLVEWNDLEKDGILDKSQIIYLEKKSAEGKTDFITLQKGRTLHGIAQDQGLTVAALSQYNPGIGKYDFIAPGTTVYLKRPAVVMEQSVALSQLEEAKQIAYHTVEPREGLYAISKKYGITIDQLKAWNNLPNDNLKIGQKLIISQ